MIFPILNGILSFRRTPVTWLLFAINLAVFLFTFRSSDNLQARLEGSLDDGVYSETQGMIFARYVNDHSRRYSANLNVLAARALASVGEPRKLMGSMAMRDTEFIKEASDLKISGDQIVINWWRKKFTKLMQMRDEHPSYVLGVTKSENDFSRLFTYQFAHSGFSHLFGNMIFFLLFACMLEPLIGGLGILTLYLSSGVIAALSFSYLSQASAIPLVGASGAISGLMSFLCVVFWGRGVRYVYFLLLPKRGFSGLIYLPAWIILVLWMLSDFAGYWSTPVEYGGVAYAAHLGGEFYGACVGLLCRQFLLHKIERQTVSAQTII